jgi:hypothetical protein
LSEQFAVNARQLWTIEDDEFVLTSTLTESQIAKLLGRSIRAIQRRKAKLRVPNDFIEQKDGAA